MPEQASLTWCVVANVVANVVGDVVADLAANHDRGGGTKHFSTGTKVWVLPPQWGDGGEDLFVVGRHRGRRGGLVRMVLPRRHLGDFRAKPVYSPAVLDQLERPWREDQDQAATWSSQAEAERVAALWSRAAEASSSVPAEPPSPQGGTPSAQ